MKINVDRSFLEINSISDLNRSKSPGSNFKITEVDPPDIATVNPAVSSLVVVIDTV